MVKALKVAMIVYGVIMILAGLMDIFMHDLVTGFYGVGEASGFVLWMGSVIGVLLLSIGVWLIVVGRDPLRNIYFLKLVITKTILCVVISVYSAAVGYVDYSQVMGIIILNAVFAVAFLVLYPWRVASISD